jgi:hypothetical protein
VTSEEFHYPYFTGEDGHVVELLDEDGIQKGCHYCQKDAHKEPHEAKNSLLLIPPVHIDTAHTVSINRIFTLIQYNGEIDQDSAVSMYFSQLFRSSVLTTRILM